MRTPVLTHAPQQDPHMAEALADGLAELLVAEYRRRHSQHNQQDLPATVASPSGLNREGINGGDQG